jgi:hypothetical protein
MLFLGQFRSANHQNLTERQVFTGRFRNIPADQRDPAVLYQRGVTGP